MDNKPSSCLAIHYFLIKKKIRETKELPVYQLGEAEEKNERLRSSVHVSFGAEALISGRNTLYRR